MTKKKDRSVQPHTSNIELCLLGTSDEQQLQKLFNKFPFTDHGWPKIAARVRQAMIDYNLDLRRNPNRREVVQGRKQPSLLRLQRSDRLNLINCMKEFVTRFDPLHIPLIAALRPKYVPETSRGKGPSQEYIDLLRRGASKKKLMAVLEAEVEQNTLRGKDTLDEEIADLRARLHRLRKLFEATPIPVSNRTNPGKQERKQLIDRLSAIFDEFTKGRYKKKGEERARNKREFVSGVLSLFKIEAPRQYRTKIQRPFGHRFL